MKCIKLRDVKVSRIGLGAMGMPHGYTGSGGDGIAPIPGTERVSGSRRTPQPTPSS